MLTLIMFSLVGKAFEGKAEEEPSQTNFLDLDVASPEVLCFRGPYRV